MNYQAIVKEIPAYTVFAVRRTIPNYAALAEIMPAVGEKVARSNPDVNCVRPDYCFNVYLDGEYRDTDIDVEICQAVDGPGRDGDGIVFKEAPAIRAVSVLHRGGYDRLGEAYAYAMGWVEQNGYRLAGHVRESYIDGIWNKADEGDWLTEIQVPVVKN